MKVNRESDDRVHVVGLATISLVAPTPGVAPVLTLVPAAPVVGPVPVPVAPVVQPVQPALVLVPPPPAAQAQSAPVHLSPVA
ncbi:uncharacterized protein PHACADRAFT_264925 [Phanerochaete carnosa HHB-10118-sp]|uniref:Uncharacterized protein n=1 Tax=Phanerochaete carnosa (strain HHB-10118-sp) TaxID=650164 RepID=K5VUT1_PHACS|nr:uncharacterized protein PHACADRAFT_264925 [Phanerochaete carnosa HHB-10118-sp]EKM50309.1 hypothetical protein PHACADRAFT_264925 [Phanerochaete carnosa HHB-10118-sp]